MAISKGDAPSNSESFKNQRYDRQLRMWGDHGQRELENAHICLINATATGCEVLKSLILPGIGEYTIVDHHKVTGADVGVNYFFDYSDIGKNRAQAAALNLNELNPLVEYNAKIIDVNSGSLDFLQSTSFSIVIASSLSDETVNRLATIFYPMNIPLMLIENHGLIGFIRIESLTTLILESHPENPVFDLRLDKPFSELLHYTNSIDLSALNRNQHSHIPYLLLLIKALQLWRELNNLPEHAIPRNYAQTKKLKEVLNQMRLQNENGQSSEQNFDEAVNYARLIHATVIPANVQQLFDAPELRSLGINEDQAFWFQVAALKSFSEQNNGMLPLCATLPDMFSDSESYIKLSNVYKEKAHKDAQLVHAILTDITKQYCAESLSFDETLKLCKHSRELTILRGTPFSQTSDPRRITKFSELCNEAKQHDNLARELANPELDAPAMPPPFYHYLALRALRLAKSNSIDDVQNRLASMIEQSATEGLQAAAKNLYCVFEKEHAGSAAILGGIGAHECVKIITKQYVPLNNTLLLDVHTGNSVVFQS